MQNKDNKGKILSFGEIKIDSENSFKPFTGPEIPILPTRDLVLFPNVTFPITLGRQMSVAAAEYSESTGNPIAIICQRDSSVDNPSVPSDLFGFGAVAHVVKIFDMPDGNKTAIIRASDKVQMISRFDNPGTNMLWAVVKIISESYDSNETKLIEVQANVIVELTERIINKTTDGPSDLEFNMKNIKNPAEVINVVATHIPLDPKVKIKLLRESDIKKRSIALLRELSKHEQMIDLTQEIQQRTHATMTEQQKAAFLNQQMEIIRRELYGDDDDAEKFRSKAQSIAFPPKVAELFEKEVSKLSRLNPQSPDYSVLYSYLDVLINLPWGIIDPLNQSLEKAQKILDADHYGLEKVKERIIEQIALMMNTPEGRSPIICLVGAPGVGKTSLGQSIARALGRKYQRVSLGGLHDEAEIRGHRRTYIGAMPGRIIDAIRRAGSSNPVLLLDEIDKIGTDIKGDPSAALLEVLDPEQNCMFHDNYVDVDFDLSKVLFIATANTLSTIPGPLLDRMEIIELSGYLPEEKIQIAKRHLLPRRLKENSLKKSQLSITDEALNSIIEGYTSESGVRQLEKRIAAIVRKAVRKKVSGEKFPAKIKPSHLKEYLGVQPYIRDRYEGNNFIGVVTGLAWTAVGGEILFIESSASKGKSEKLTLTGNLGDVMKESAMIALQYVKSNADALGINPEVFDTCQLHIHVPEGAIPKDGPSAGITMATSIASTLTGRKIAPRIAMTGEITLRGRVLPVGGIKEKILAAKRAGIDKIILSKENRKDIEDIPEQYIEGLKFIYVDSCMDVFEAALLS